MSATATTTTTRSSQQYDAWRQWSRRARRQQRTQTNLISENHVDSKVYNFMQIEIHFRADINDRSEESRLRGVVHYTHKGDLKQQQSQQSPKHLGSDCSIYVPTTAPIKSTPAATRPTGRRQRQNPNTRTMRTPTPTHTTKSTTQEESKEHDDTSRLEPHSSSLLRVTTSMVLDLQQCLLSQIQLERQDHHLPAQFILHQQPEQSHSIGMPALPPAEASNAASSLSNSNNSSSSSNAKSSTVATCLICPATVHVPPSKHALVYCTNCTTLATASLLRKQQYDSNSNKKHELAASSLSDLSSSIVSQQ